MIYKNNLQRNPIIKYEDRNIKIAKTFRYLGVVIDEKLNFNVQIEKTANKIITVGN